MTIKTRLLTAAANFSAAATAWANLPSGINEKIGKLSFGTVTDMLASNYVGGGAGTIWFAGGFNYKEATSNAVDHQLVTAGGVKLYVLPNSSNEVSVAALGTLADVAAGIEAIDIWAQSKGYIATLGPTTYTVTRTVNLTCRHWRSNGGLIKLANNTVVDAVVKYYAPLGFTHDIRLTVDGSQSTNIRPTQTNGSLVVGAYYLISGKIAAGDDFTNVGVAIGNTESILFQATGTTPTSWANNTSLRRVTVGVLIQDLSDSTAHPIHISAFRVDIPVMLSGNCEKLTVNVGAYNDAGSPNSIMVALLGLTTINSSNETSADEITINVNGNNFAGWVWVCSGIADQTPYAGAGHATVVVNIAHEQSNGTIPGFMLENTWGQFGGNVRSINNECILVKSSGSYRWNLGLYAGAFTNGSIGRIYAGDHQGNITTRQTFAKGLGLYALGTWAVNYTNSGVITSNPLQLGSLSEGLQLANVTIAGYNSLRTGAGNPDLIIDNALGVDVQKVDCLKVAVSAGSGSTQNSVRLGGKSYAATYAPESSATASRNKIVYPAISASSLSSVNGGTVYSGMEVDYIRSDTHAGRIKATPRYPNQSAVGWAMEDGTFLKDSGSSYAQARGNATFTTAGGSQTFAHGLPFTPIAANFEIQKTNAVTGNLVVTAADATNFTVQCDTTPASNINFGWRARVALN